MASGIAQNGDGQPHESASGITEPVRDELLAGYEATLARVTTLAASTQAKYVQRVRAFLDWLAATDVDGDPLSDPMAAKWAARDYRLHLKRRRASVSTINGALAAIDDFNTRRGLGKTELKREDAERRTAPKALSHAEAKTYLRMVEANARARDAVVALTPYYAGLRVEELVNLDVDDVQMSARKGNLHVMGKGGGGGKPRTVPIPAALRPILSAWLEDRRSWKGADSPALLLNTRGGRLSDRSAREIIVKYGKLARLGDEEPFGPHVLRHTYGTRLVRDGHDLVAVAELMGHARIETTRLYSLPTEEDKAAMVESIPSDR